MKIMVATTKGGLDDIVSNVFGRCATFTIVEVDAKEIKNATVVPNQFAGDMGGVGIQVAQLAAKEGVRAVIAGRFGPHASQVLAQAGIVMAPVVGIPVREAVGKYLLGEALAPGGSPTTWSPGFGGWGKGHGRRYGGRDGTRHGTRDGAGGRRGNGTGEGQVQVPA
ncbi:MAG: NifB/NifX family molybdenum-iron cluster-binding protein, partial [Thermoplasmata archaeon]